MCKIENVRNSFKNKQMDGFNNATIMKHIQANAECNELYKTFERLTKKETK